MRLTFECTWQPRRNGHAIVLRLHMTDAEVAQWTRDEALDVAVMLYGDAQSKLADACRADDAAGRRHRRRLVLTATSDAYSPELIAGVVAMLNTARTVRPSPELEEVRSQLAACLVLRYTPLAALGRTP